eukprot:gnl/TRDRNA2_/TRDRNA2_37605_c0_seq1.p1 gnl/TRDRNA2_/TRDRNA2_37605_c0~~gnl/TRDRNA2_/TRDRNA2_37605_c0_seq1.p1  ORF type:complete len:459 (+),score=135.38 gnl/TRDRNA2_/TRDRNA2_37605_c0_seq1:85-1461(+)
MDSAALFPISEISAYTSKWMIKARVTSKTPTRTFTKGAGGKVFSCDLLDKEGGEIRATFWHAAVDKYADMLQVGKCFTFSRGSVKIANRQFNLCNHKYELNFDKEALVEESADDIEVAALQFNFCDLRSLQAKPEGARVDICGIVKSFNAYVAFNAKDGRELVKREIVVADDTATCMDVTLWGERAKIEDDKFKDCPVIALKGVIVKDFQGGRSGSLMQQGQMLFSPKGPEAEKVQKWWSSGGSSQSLTEMSTKTGGGAGIVRDAKPMTLTQVRAASEGNIDGVEYYSVVGRLALVQTKRQGEPQPLCYMACQEQKPPKNLPCQRRVDENGHCNSCDITGKSAPRMNVRCRFLDAADSLWLTTFHEAAVQVLGMSGEETMALEKQAAEKGEAGREAMEGKLKSRYFSMLPFDMTLRAKTDMYEGKARSNITCVGAKPVQRGVHGRKLLSEIQEMLAVH